MEKSGLIDIFAALLLNHPLSKREGYDFPILINKHESLRTVRRLRSQDYCVASPQILTPRTAGSWISLWDLNICGNQTQGALKPGPGVQGRPTREQCGGHFLPSRRELSHVAERNQKEGECASCLCPLPLLLGLCPRASQAYSVCCT